MNGGDHFATVLFGVFEGVLGDASRGLLRDQLDRLHHAVHDLKCSGLLSNL